MSETANHGFKRVHFIYVPTLSQSLSVLILQYRVNDISGELGVTPDHLIFDEHGDLKQAKELQIGDVIQTVHGKGTIANIKHEDTTKVRTIVTTKGSQRRSCNSNIGGSEFGAKISNDGQALSVFIAV